MDSNLDLMLYPLGQGYEQGQIPGCHAAMPPRNPARGRNADRLIMHLALVGNAPLDAKQQAQLLDKLSRQYYNTSGTVTNAMRLVVEQLNRFLLDRNLQNSNKGMQSIGLLTLAVVRSGRIYLAQCGPTQAFLVTGQETHHLIDPQEARRGLGKNRLASIRYWQFELHPRDILIISPNPPPAWIPSSLQAFYGQGLGKLHRFLTSNPDIDQTSLLVMTLAGSGKLQIAGSQSGYAGDHVAGSTEKVTGLKGAASIGPGSGSKAWLSATINRMLSVLPTGRTRKNIPGSVIGQTSRRSPVPNVRPALSTSVGQNLPTSTPISDAGLGEAVGDVGFPKPELSISSTVPRRPVMPPSPPGRLESLKRIPTKFGQAIGKGLYRASSVLFDRFGQDRNPVVIPSSVMAFIAVVVPVVVVTITSVIYLQTGRTTLYESNYQEAYNLVAQSQKETNPEQQRQLWQSALDALDKAEDYHLTDESQKLRVYIQSNLDQQEGTERLDFQPIIWGGLPNTVKVSRIIAIDEDLYLLNSTYGNVLRATRTGRGYEIDREFQCGPGVGIGKLVDVTTLPRDNTEEAVLLGIDNSGILVYCKLKDAPKAKILPSPDMGWGVPKFILLESGNLFVLDPKANAIWVFFPDEKTGEYSASPSFYFGDEVPNVKDVAAMVIHQADLIMIHEDGRLTTCTYGLYQGVPTRCVDPAMLTDFHSQQEKVPLIKGAHFGQLLYAPPPDPSFYMLDTEAPVIYHFSLKLTLQRQFRPRQALPEGAASAFALGPDRRTFYLALGDNIYSATLP